MGTRCLIDILGEYGQRARLYHHFDGYPENVVPFIQEVEQWIHPMLSPSEKHLARDPDLVAATFSQYELNCLKQCKAEAEAKGEGWSKDLSPLGSFISVAPNQAVDFDVWFDVEFYYLVAISRVPWQVEPFEVVRDYGQALAEQRIPRFIGLEPHEVSIEALPHLLRCEICGDLYPKEMTERDHRLPKSQGGKRKPFNRRLVCANCHSFLHRADERTFSRGQQKLFETH